MNALAYLYNIVEGRQKKMGKDRQEKKLKKSKKVESDRDQSIDYPGATKISGPEEVRKLNK